jgi:nitrite reductase/ring-hydroxylating ferredoxin subunit
MSDSATRIRLCGTLDVPEGGAIKIATHDLELAVFHVEGSFYVTDDLCTHGPGSLSEGFLEGCVIECDFHGGAFDIRTGEVAAPPCVIPLKTYPVTVEDDSVYIDLI